MKLPKHSVVLRAMRIVLTTFAALLLLLANALQAEDGAPLTEPEEDSLLTVSDETLEDYTSGWYRTEILIFVRDLSSASHENWDPLPLLQYPDEYQQLIDPALAERRRGDAAAFDSSFATNGIQRLTVPRRMAFLESVLRPDIDPVPVSPLDPNSPEFLLDEASAADPLDSNGLAEDARALDDLDQSALDPNSPVAEDDSEHDIELAGHKVSQRARSSQGAPSWKGPGRRHLRGCHWPVACPAQRPTGRTG